MSDWVYEHDAEQLRYGYAIKAELAHVKSDFQDIKVVDSLAYGKILLIDDTVMITERDEFVYREMIAHVPLCNHASPHDVLIIGGGDGGVVREVVRYAEINTVTLCEIDGAVIEVCQQHFPELTESLQDKRVKIEISDGLKFLADSAPASYDVVIVDSTDPVGPGLCLSTSEFYRAAARALRAGGIMAAQTQSPWERPELLRRINDNIKTAFKHVHPYLATVPTYPRALWSWTLAANRALDPASFARRRFQTVAPHLRYLTAELMSSAFHLPRFYQEELGEHID